MIKRFWCNWPSKIQMDTNGKSLISHFSYATGLWIWGENWTLGKLGSGEGKSTQCQSNPQSRAVRGGVFGRRARWPAQTSSRPTWWTPSGSAPLPDTATPDTRALVVPAVRETEGEGEDWWRVKKEMWWVVEENAKRRVWKEERKWVGNWRLLHKHANIITNVQ